MLQSKRTKKLIKDIATYITLFLMAIIIVVPFLWMVLTSLKGLSEIWKFPPTFVPKRIIWSNYIEVWGLAPFFRYFINSIYITISITFGQLVMSSLAAYAFARLRFPGRDFIFFAYIATMMMPFAIVMVPLFLLMSSLHKVNTHFALIIPGLFNGLFNAFGIFLLRQFVLTIPTSLDDAAVIDGCSLIGIYWRIILPLSKPALVALGLFIFTMSWNDFLWPLIVIDTAVKRTLPLGIAALTSKSVLKTPWHLYMAASTLASIPPIFIFLFGQNFFIKGITLTGLKE